MPLAEAPWAVDEEEPHPNPFGPEVVEWERSIVGADDLAGRAVWNPRARPEARDRALAMVGVIADRVMRDARERLRMRRSATGEELALYESTVAFTLYRRYREPLRQVHLARGGWRGRVPCYREFRCAVTRRHSSAGANPARQLSLQPVAVGADDGGNDIG